MQLFLSFIRNPIYYEEFKGFEIKKFFFLLFFYFVLMIPIGLILFFLLNILNINHKVADLSFQEKILYGILISPIVEELLFRLILVFNKKNLVILILTTSSLMVYFVIKVDILKTLIFFLLIGSFIILYKYEDKCKSYFQSNFKVFFFLISGLFAFLHIINFHGISMSNLLYLPLFVIPQFILGLILGYIRIIYGLQYSIFFHIIVNCTIII